jgi:hypothetical protein
MTASTLAINSACRQSKRLNAFSIMIRCSSPLIKLHRY